MLPVLLITGPGETLLPHKAALAFVAFVALVALILAMFPVKASTALHAGGITAC